MRWLQDITKSNRRFIWLGSEQIYVVSFSHNRMLHRDNQSPYRLSPWSLDTYPNDGPWDGDERISMDLREGSRGY